MARVSIFIDGFNVYHALNDAWDNINKCKKYRRYLWLNYRAFAEQFVRTNDNLETVFYFTAFANWRPASASRHRIYIEALKHHGVDIDALVLLKEDALKSTFCQAAFLELVRSGENSEAVFR